MGQGFDDDDEALEQVLNPKWEEEKNSNCTSNLPLRSVSKLKKERTMVAQRDDSGCACPTCARRALSHVSCATCPDIIMLFSVGISQV